jgi:hypothetical protein
MVCAELIKGYRGDLAVKEADAVAAEVNGIIKEMLKGRGASDQEDLVSEQEIESKMQQKIKEMVTDKEKTDDEINQMVREYLQKNSNDQILAQEEMNDEEPVKKLLTELVQKNRKSLFQKFAELHVDYFIIAALYATQITYLLLKGGDPYDLKTGKRKKTQTVTDEQGNLMVQVTEHFETLPDTLDDDLKSLSSVLVADEGMLKLTHKYAIRNWRETELLGPIRFRHW